MPAGCLPIPFLRVRILLICIKSTGRSCVNVTCYYTNASIGSLQFFLHLKSIKNCALYRNEIPM